MKSTFSFSAMAIAVAGGLSAGTSNQVKAEAAGSAVSIEQVQVIGQRPTSIAVLDINSNDAMLPDFRDALVHLPGINSNGNGPLTAIVQYRGLFGDRIRVNIDGAPVVGAGPNAMDPPLSNVFSTPGTNIKLYRGVAPVSVGPETLGGALNIERDYTTLFANKAEWRGKLDVQRQSEGSAKHYLGTVGYHDSDVFMQVFAANQERDDINDGNGNLIPNSFYERSAYGAQAGFRKGNHQFTASVQRIDTDETGTPALAMDIIYIDSAAWRLQYQWQDKDVGTFSFRTFGNSNQHGMNNFAFRDATMDPMSRLNTVDSLAHGYEAVWNQTLASGELTLGADWHTASHNSTITNPILNNFNIHNFNGIERTSESVFGEWQHILNSTQVTAGLRYTQIDANAGEVSHSMAMMNPNVVMLVDTFNNAERELDFDFVDATLHLNGELSEQWQWHAAVGQKGRAPSYQELFVWFPLGISAGMADGRNYLGNLELEHEQARQVDLGLTWQSQNLSVSPRVFYQDIDDFIVGNMSANQTANMVSTMMTGAPPLEWGNADASLYGFDILLSATLSEQLKLDMTASLVEGDRDDLDEPLYRIAPASLITQLSWTQDNWQAEVEWQLIAEQNEVSVIQNEMESTGFGIINAMFRYQFNSHVELTLQAYNLLDKAYQPHLGGVNRIAGIAQPQGERLFAPGRILGANLSLGF